MFHSYALGLWPAALLLLSLSLSLSAGATPPAAVQRPAKADPLDAAAAVPALTYRSVFAPYRGQRELPLRSWKDANDEVARIGGWRVYAREAALPDAAAAPAAAPEPTPASPTASAPAAPARTAPATAPARPATPGGTPAAQPAPPSPSGHRHHQGKP